MDRSNYYLQSLIEVCRKRNDGYWELLATAANCQKSVEKSYLGVSVPELKKGSFSSFSVSPSFITKRIEALSVSNLELLRELRSKLSEVKNDNPAIDFAKKSLNKLFSMHEMSDFSKKWTLDNEINAGYFRVLELCSLRYESSFLGYDDCVNIIMNNPFLFKAFLFQSIEIETVFFDKYFLGEPVDDPFIDALIVKLSQNSGFDFLKWYPKYITMTTSSQDALSLTPVIYILLNKDWCSFL